MQPEILRLNNQSVSAPGAPLPSHIHGSIQRFPTQQYPGEDPYFNSFQQRTTTNGNLSDQKTPTRHPNTFLYRAHLNLNDASSIAKDEHALDQFHGHLHHNHGTNVSAFYHEEARDDLSLNSAEEHKDDQLRVANSDSSDLQCRETEISQPILHLMHMHRMGGQQHHRFSNASANQSHNYLSEENSGFLMGVSDEFQDHRLSAGHMGEYNRGRQQSTTHQKIQPVYQKNQSSPSKMFRQFNPQCGAGASRSPYRNIVDKSESSSIGPQTTSSYGGFQAGLNISPVNQQKKMAEKGI